MRGFLLAASAAALAAAGPGGASAEATPEPTVVSAKSPQICGRIHAHDTQGNLTASAEIWRGHTSCSTAHFVIKTYFHKANGGKGCKPSEGNGCVKDIRGWSCAFMPAAVSPWLVDCTRDGGVKGELRSYKRSG